jgi:2-dehydro-3-deoxyphosphooctonate aldolase (KDO 8-P synthase)
MESLVCGGKHNGQGLGFAERGGATLPVRIGFKDSVQRPVQVVSPSGDRRIPFDRQSERLTVIAGPCVIEDEALLGTVAAELVRLQQMLPVDFIFKSSYRKANRTSASSFTGIGDEVALRMLQGIRSDYDLPTLTDIHSEEDAELAAVYVDVLQIPAFLARQTELLLSAAQTGKVINVKKGQFMAPQDMKFAIDKIASTGNESVLVTERGTFFGYGDLVVDYRSLVAMAKFGSPVIFDATHSVQRPSQDGRSGGQREYIAPLARAAVAIGVDGIFIETHPDPAKALSDKDSQLPLNQLEALLEELLTIRNAGR